MAEHELKIDRVYLDALIDGSKTFEVRYNDRGYQRGDLLRFYDGRIQRFREFEVTYVHSGLGIKEGWVALAVTFADGGVTHGNPPQRDADDSIEVIRGG